MALANVALTDTFDYWRTITNSMVVAINDKLVYCNTSNTNSVSIPPFVSRSSNLYVNIITSTSVSDAATPNVASAFSVNTVNELALSYSRAANSNTQTSVTGANTWANTVGTSGNTYVSILVANNAVGANNWANTKLANTSNAVFNGRLGINTAPSAMLSVYGGSTDTVNGVANFLTPVPSTGYNFLAVGRGLSSTNSAIYGYANTSTPYGFVGVWGAAVGTGTLNVDSNGNVGVGTATPVAKLDVNGTSNFSGFMDVIQSGRFLAPGSGSSGAIILRQNGGDTAGAYLQWVDYANANQKGYIQVDTAGKMRFASIGTERFTIDASGLSEFSGTISIAKSNVLNQTLSDGSTINWDTSLGQVAYITLGGNRTMAAPTNLKVGTYILHVVQDGSGSRTISWNSVFKWPAGVAPVLSTGAGRRDIISFVSDGTYLYGSYLPDVR